jgi:hypothetical protein
MSGIGMCNGNRPWQSGGSLLGNLLLVALITYGGYIGIQYVPQMIESSSLDSMLDTLESQHRTQRYESGHQVEQAVKSLLNLNGMDDLEQSIQVSESGQGARIEIEYERELDLLYTTKTLRYHKSLELD